MGRAQAPGMLGGQICKRTLDSWRKKPGEEGTSQGDTKVRGGKVVSTQQGLLRAPGVGGRGLVSPLPWAPTFQDPPPTRRTVPTCAEHA